MKIKVKFIFLIGMFALIVIVGSLFLVIKSNGGVKTIKEAIAPPGSKPISIIYEEKTDIISLIIFLPNSLLKF